MSHLQDLLLHDNTLVRRATTQLLCNLVPSIAGEAFYRPPAPKDSATSTTKYKIPAPLHLLLILIASDDLPTRIAASGAVATLCGQSMECSRAILLDDDEKRSEKNLAIVTELLVAIALSTGSAGDNPLVIRGLSISYSMLFGLEQLIKEEKELGMRRLTKVDLRGKLESCTGAQVVREDCLKMLVALSK